MDSIKTELPEMVYNTASKFGNRRTKEAPPNSSAKLCRQMHNICTRAMVVT